MMSYLGLQITQSRVMNHANIVSKVTLSNSLVLALMQVENRMGKKYWAV